MGLSLRDKAANAVEATVHEQAHAAHLEGRPVYCPTLGVASGIAGGLGVDPWAVAIDAIEAAGWHLEHWAIDPRGNARPVFRRVVDEQVIDH